MLTKVTNTASSDDPVCPLCGRPIPHGVPQSMHHLIPKSRGGRGSPTVLLHHICHKEIQKILSEGELEKHYSTVDALLRHPETARFVSWVAKRPPGFISKSYRRRR
ncbi:MAG: HNH endonuclease [Pseudomonadota bacterium]